MSKSLYLTPADEKLIPPSVRALYRAGVLSKEQLDTYIGDTAKQKLAEEETRPKETNLAAPVVQEPQKPEYGVLDTLKDTGTAVQTGAVSGLVGLGNLAAQGLSTQGEWAGRFMEATGLPQVGKPLREFSETYGDVASRETGAYREALQGVASERKSEGLLQSEQALGALLDSDDFKKASATDQISRVAKFVSGNKKLAAYMAAESVGGLASGGPLAKAANLLRGSSLASNVAARLAGGGVLAGQELAGIQADVYNTVFQETGDAEKAKQAASTASTDPVVLLAAGLDAFTGAEATSLFTGVQKAARRATRPTLTSLMAAGGKAAVGEAGGEAFQEGAQARAENLAFGRDSMENVYGQAALGAIVGGPVGGAFGVASNVADIKQANADAEARIAQGKTIYENIAKGGADIATLSEARTAIARSLGLEADTIEDAKTLANRFQQKSVPNSTRAKTVAETIMTGDPAFDAGQKAAQQTFQLADQFKPVEATVTQFEPLSRRPATPVQGNLGSFTVEAPVAKETLSERGLKKANQRFDKDTRILDSEIENLRSQLGQNVDPITGVDPVRAQIDEAETIREGIARERLRAAEKAKPAEPTPYAKEMRRFQETKPSVEVNAKIPEAPKISRAESITNKVAEEVQTKTKKELPKNTKQRVTKVAALVEDELTYSGALRGLDDNAANAAVLAKTREYLASGEKEADLVERVRGLMKQKKAEASERMKTAATALNNQDEVLSSLDRNLGKDAVDGLIRSDKVRVLSDFDRVDVPMSAEERSRGQGVYVDKDGTIYLNAKNLSGKKDDKGNLKREIAMAVLAHEQGHTKNFRTEDGKRVPLLKGLAGDAAYDALNRAITDASTKGGRIGDIAKRAQERAQKGVDAAQKAGRQVELKDELPQYFVEELMNSYDGPIGQFRKFIDQAGAKARDIINRSPLKMDIRPQDLGWMVKQDLIAESKTEKTTGSKQAKLSLGTKEATGFEEAKKQGKTFTSPVTGEEIFEIPDTDMKVNAGILRAANGKPIDLETALVHDELFKQWPFLRKDVKIKLTDKFALNEAEYDPQTKTITLSTQNVDNIYNFALSAEAKKEARKDISKTVLHEITHAIQDKIGAEMGSNPTFEMYEYVQNKLRNMNNNKLAAEYSKVLNAVKRNQKSVDKLFKGISKLREQWEAKGKKWPTTYTDLDIHIANDPALAGQIMPFVKGLGLNSLRELHETYNFLRQAKNAGYWAYMANRGEVTARAVAHVFDGKFDTLKQAEEAVAKQFGELGTQGNNAAVFDTFEQQAQAKKIKPEAMMSLGEDVKTKAQETSGAVREKTSVAWKYLKGALWDIRPAKFKIAEEMRDGYVRYIEQKGREMAQRMIDAANRDGITLSELTTAWMEAQETGVLGETRSAKVNAELQEMRDEIDNLSQEIEQVYDESGTPLSDKMKATFNKNLFSYISRSFEIDFDKQWGQKLLKAAKKDPNGKEAQVISNLRDWLSNEVVVNLESLETLDDKALKRLYKRLIDQDTKGKTTAQMTKELEAFRGTLKSEEIVNILQNDILRLSKVSGVGSYYRGAARNEGILQKKSKIPEPILAAMGERIGPAESFLTTIVRQGALYAQTKMLADFRKAMPDSFTEDQTTVNTVRIENKQGKYGPLAGLYTTPEMKQFIEDRVTQHERNEDLLYNLHSAYAQEEAASRLIKGGLQKLANVSGGYKVLTIMTNTMNYLYNIVNGTASLARYNTLGTVYGMDYTDKDGNKIPLHKWFPELAADFLWRGSVTGTNSHELYGLAVTANFVGSAMSGDIKEAFLDTIRETVQGKKPGRIKTAWRRATWLADAWFSGPEALPNILGAVVESNYLRALWTEQGREFTHDELMAAAADRVKRNAISRDRAIPVAKMADKYAAQAFLTFFTETVRAPAQTLYDVAVDLKESNDPSLSPKARNMKRNHAMLHLAGVATAAGTIYAITQAVGAIFGHPFGTEDDEDPEGLDEEYRDRPEDLIVIGTDKDGRKLVFDLSKLNTYSLLTNVTKEIAEGNFDAAAEQAKSFLFANPLPQKVWTELTDKYGEAGKSDLALAINNAIAGTPLGSAVDPTAVNEMVKVMSMFNPGFVKDPQKALENADGLQENMVLGFVGMGARPVAYHPVKTLRYKMGEGLDNLENARSKLNAVMRTKGVNEATIKQEMRRYYNAERDLILKNRPLVQAALKNDISAKELRQLFKFLGANKHLNEQMLSNKPYKPTPMHKNWLTMSEKLATLGEPPKVKEEQGMIYTQNKAAYRKLFKEIYGNKE